MKILTKWVFIAAFVQALSLYIIFGLMYLPGQKKLLQDSLFDRTKTKSGFYFPLIKKSLESKNDILMMNSLEGLSRDSEVLYARLIDNEGRIIAHSKIQEWGKKLDDPAVNQMILLNEPAILKTSEGYDYSIPVISSTTKIASFSLGFTTDKIDTGYKLIKNRAIKTACVIFIATTLFYIIVFRLLILAPLAQLQERIESAILGQAGEKIGLENNDEIGKLALTIDKLIDKLTGRN